MSQLDLLLARQRKKEEDDPRCSFEVERREDKADTTWDQPTSGQFTPRASGGLKCTPREELQRMINAELASADSAKDLEHKAAASNHSGQQQQQQQQQTCDDSQARVQAPSGLSDWNSRNQGGHNTVSSRSSSPTVTTTESCARRAESNPSIGGAAEFPVGHSSDVSEETGHFGLSGFSTEGIETQGRAGAAGSALSDGLHATFSLDGDPMGATFSPADLPLAPDDFQAARDMEPRISEMGRATIDAGGFPPELEELRVTAPASPTGSNQDVREDNPLTPPSVAGALATAGSKHMPTQSNYTLGSSGVKSGLGPSQGAGAGQTSQTSKIGEKEQSVKPSMSSTSYFQAYMRQQPTQDLTPAPAAVTPKAASTFASNQPFPKAKEAVFQQKLVEVAADVNALRDKVIEVTGRSQMHPSELQQIVKAADTIQARTRLSDAELEGIGWPTRTLQQMRETTVHFDSWQRCEDAAKWAINEGDAPLHEVVHALEGLLGAWRRLSVLEKDPIITGIGLKRRAKGAVPMMSALLDQAMVLVRREPNVLIVRQLEALLRHSAGQPEMRELGVEPALQSALHELSDSVQGLPQATTNSAPGMYLAAPEIIWRAITEGDAATVAAIIRQGGLVSGQTRDSHGHTVLWDAIAFGSTEVALLLLKAFPPDQPYGVDLGELHARNGSSLLHLVAGLQVFASQAEGLLAMLFERMPESLRNHRNARNQTFLHVAAGRLNLWVLKFAAVRGLEALFTAEDDKGWTPRSLLDRHMAERGVAERAPTPRMKKGSCGPHVPPWASLSALQPLAPGSKPPFSDVVVEVQDEHRGCVEIHAHRIVLAACSRVWHRALATAPRPEPLKPKNTDGSQEKAQHHSKAVSPTVLPLLPTQCCNADVALFALRFLYTGTTSCTFQADAQLLLQLLQLCVDFSLPAPLMAWALDALFKSMAEGQRPATDEPAALLQRADKLALSPEERCFLARRLFASDTAWEAIDKKLRGQQIEQVLGVLEPFLTPQGPAGRTGPSFPTSTMPSAPCGSANWQHGPTVQGQTDPGGGRWR